MHATRVGLVMGRGEARQGLMDGGAAVMNQGCGCVGVGGAGERWGDTMRLQKEAIQIRLFLAWQPRLHKSIECTGMNRGKAVEGTHLIKGTDHQAGMGHTASLVQLALRSGGARLGHSLQCKRAATFPSNPCQPCHNPPPARSRKHNRALCPLSLYCTPQLASRGRRSRRYPLVDTPQQAPASRRYCDTSGCCAIPTCPPCDSERSVSSESSGCAPPIDWPRCPGPAPLAAPPPASFFP